MTTKFQFPPLTDKNRFPLLAATSDMPCSFLMSCDTLLFSAPDNPGAAPSIARQSSAEWHQYGDVRWPGPAQWVEFPLSDSIGRFNCGVLIIREHVPSNETSPFRWIARNHPLRLIHSGMAAPDAAKKLHDLFELQRKSTEQVAGPVVLTPAFAQSYCLFAKHTDSDCELLATYTDVLNPDGIPIPQFRIADVAHTRVALCRLILHALFKLNEARVHGMNYVTHAQCAAFEPVFLDGNQAPPKWAGFHPCRTLRSRPTLRDLDPPHLVDGTMSLDDHQQITELRRLEWNTHMLGFERIVRPRDISDLGRETNSTLAAYLNRAQGGAIYVLPDMLVEEFNHTDCSEVRLSDICLPFFNLFLRFTPPERIFLTDKAYVDGCYVVNQGDEYLFTLTSRKDDVDYENSLSVVCLDPIFSLHLPASDADITINKAVQMGVDAFLSENAPPDENLSTAFERPDGAVHQFIDVRAESRRRRIETFRTQEPMFRACLNIIVNAACFISFRPSDIVDSWEGQPADDILSASKLPEDSRRNRDRKTGALQKIAKGDYTRIKICGRDLFNEPQRHSLEGLGKSPRTHWRRGHWRRQKHGSGLSLIAVRWIRPTLVNPDHSPLVETRFYEV